MKIEEAIRQRNFINEYQKAHINILYTAATINQRAAKLLRAYGLTWQQFNVLRILRGQYPEPATVKLLTERMIDKTSNASRLVDKLLEKKLVQRTTSTEDRRRVDVEITALGLKLIDDASKAIEVGLKFHDGNLNEAEAIQLNTLLDTLRGDADS